MIRLRDLFLLLVVAVMCTGGSFTCRSGDIDEDDPPAQTRIRIGR